MSGMINSAPRNARWVNPDGTPTPEFYRFIVNLWTQTGSGKAPLDVGSDQLLAFTESATRGPDWNRRIGDLELLLNDAIQPRHARGLAEADLLASPAFARPAARGPWSDNDMLALSILTRPMAPDPALLTALASLSARVRALEAHFVGPFLLEDGTQLLLEDGTQLLVEA
jgi:hypothetical protein